MSGVITLAVGGSGSLGLKSDGTVWTWGYDVDGVSYRASPIPVVNASGSGYFNVGGSATGVPAAFAATASGTAAKLSLSGILTIAGTDVGKNGVFYLAANVSGSWFLNSNDSWVAYRGGTLPVYSTGVLTNRTIEILRDANVAALAGTQIVLGYGTSEADMLQGGKYAVIYTIP